MDQVMAMNRIKTGKKEQTGERRLPALGGVFLLGALGGSLCCARLEWLQTLLYERGQASRGLWQNLWPDLALLAVVLLSGYLRSGCLMTLLATAVKGFFLSAETTLQVLELGNHGYAAAVTKELLPGFFALAALMLLGRQAMGWSVARLRFPPGRGKRLVPDSTYFLTAAICAGLILTAAVLKLYLSPTLWAVTQSFLPAA